jgi:hypothetical protein
MPRIELKFRYTRITAIGISRLPGSPKMREPMMVIQPTEYSSEWHYTRRRVMTVSLDQFHRRRENHLKSKFGKSRQVWDKLLVCHHIVRPLRVRADHQPIRRD